MTEDDVVIDTGEFTDDVPEEVIEEVVPSQRMVKTSIGSALRSMIPFYTILPMNFKDDEHAKYCIDSMESNFWLTPVVGMIIGIMALIVGVIVMYVSGIFQAAVATLATVFFVSKFLHFDGLVDFGDAMVATGNMEKKRRALKDTCIGAGGLGVGLIVTLMSVAFMVNLGIYLLILIIASEIFVKNAMVVTAVYGKPSDGMAGRQVANADRFTLVTSTLVSLVLGFIAVVLSYFIVGAVWGDPFFSMPQMLLVYVIAALAASLSGVLIAETSNKNLGSVNGDVLGASNEIGRMVFFFMASVVLFAIVRMM